MRRLCFQNMAKEIKKNKDKSYMPGYDVDDQVPRTNYSGSSRSFLNNFPKTPKTEPKRKDAASSRQPVSKSVFYADCTSGPLSASGPSSFLEATTESSPLTGSEPGLTHSLKTSSPLPIANAKSSMAGSTNKQESSSFNDDTKTSLTNYAKYSDRKIINTNSLPRDRSRTAGK